MNRPLDLQPHRFFLGTRALPCPYIPGRIERKVVTDLATPNAAELYERLSRAGFRRSHGLAYRPACPGCTACVPVRIAVDDLIWTKTFRRIVNRNTDITVQDLPAHATMDTVHDEPGLAPTGGDAQPDTRWGGIKIVDLSLFWGWHGGHPPCRKGFAWHDIPEIGNS